ncbi:MAG TPA: hypothetical protein VKZ59_03430 [Acidobacteriota bacterium]|nr:hypothetical protein [Acidobacteriota bacterium]
MTEKKIVSKLRDLRIADMTIEREEKSALALTGEQCFKGVRIWLEDGSSFYLSELVRFYPAPADLNQAAEVHSSVQGP